MEVNVKWIIAPNNAPDTIIFAFCKGILDLAIPFDTAVPTPPIGSP